ncbi:MAG: flagellar basal-body rod protein FlgG [Planctomycetota bacterium]
MLKAFFASATGMRAQELLIDNTANNLANVNTTGFKKKHMNFADLIYDTIKPAGADTGNGQFRPVGLEIGSGVNSIGTTTIFTQGTPIESAGPLHMMIEGEGFFQVTRGAEIAYTRDGSFNLDAQGNVVTADGYLLDPQVTVPATAELITVSPSGIVSYQENGARVTAGTIQLSRFANPAGLRSLGGNLFAESAASGVATQGEPGLDGTGSIRHGFLELANVEVVSELVSLITAQRAYEINSRAIRAGDEMLSTASDMVR